MIDRESRFDFLNNWPRGFWPATVNHTLGPPTHIVSG